MLVQPRSTLANARYISALTATLFLALGCPSDPPKSEVLEPRVLAFKVDQGLLKSGEIATFSWKTENAQSVAIALNGTRLHQASGEAAKEGSAPLTITQGGTYLLEAQGEGGAVSHSRIVITLQDAPIIEQFVAVPAEVVLGSETSLRWKVKAGTALTITTQEGTEILSETSAAEIADGSKRVVITEDTHFVLSVTNLSGTHTQSVSVKVLPPAKLTLFTATPALISAGEKATLQWTAEEALDVSLVANGESITVPAGTDPNQGSLEVSPTATTTYVLTVIGSGGNASLSRTVTLRAAPTITRFNLEPPSIVLGRDTATLSWETEESTSVSVAETLNGNTTQVDLLGAGVNGSVVVSPTTAGVYRYQLSATGPGGVISSQERTLTVIDPAPVIEAFTADKNQIVRGEGVSLAWTTRSTASVSLSSSSASEGTQTIDLTGKGVNDSITVTPAKAGQYTFTLTATHPDGTSVQSTPVVVDVSSPPPTILSFAPSVKGLTVPGSVELSWTTIDATHVTLTQNDGTTTSELVAAGAASGSFTVPLTATGTYTYALTAAGPTAPAAVEQLVVTAATTAPVLTAFDVSPSTVDLGEDISLSWSATDARSYRITANDEVIYSLGGTSTTYRATSAGTVLFKIVAVGDGGEHSDASFDRTVTVTANPAIVSFTSSASRINEGQSVTLSWQTTDATEIALSDGTQSFDVSGQSPVSGTLEVFPTGSGVVEYTLVARRGSTPEASAKLAVTVDAPPPSVTGFDVQPRVVTLGSPVQLSWNTSAEDVYLTPWAQDPELDFGWISGQAFEDIATSGTVINDGTGAPLSGDEGIATLSFPSGFTFPFFGEAQRQARVSVNGILSFGASDAGLSLNGPLLSSSTPLQVIAPFWDDLKAYAGTSRLLYALKDAGSPDERLIIQWDRIGLYQSGNTPSNVLTFQVALFKAGDVEFRYGPRTGARVAELSGSSATIGLQGPAESLGYQYSFETANQVSPNRSFRIGQRLGGGVGSGAPITLKETSELRLLAVNFNGSIRTSAITTRVVATPAISEFTPDREVVGSGDPIVLSWNTPAATSWRLLANGAELTGVPQQSPGAFTHHPAANTTYTLIVANDAGTETTQTLEVNVGAPAITFFRADEPIKALGQPVTLSWETVGARTVTVTQGATSVVTLNDPADRAQIRAGSTVHVPPAGQAITYVITATNGSGSLQETVTIESTAEPRIVFFKSGASRVTTGDPLTLSWTAVNAAKVTLRETTSVSPPKVEYETTLPAELISGSVVRNAPAVPAVRLPGTGPVLYAAQVEAADGSLSPEVLLEVTVLARPSFTTLERDPTNPAVVGQPLTLHWETQDAVLVKIFDQSKGVYLTEAAAPLGSLDLTLLQTPASLRFEAINEFGHQTDSVLSFPLAVPPPTLDLQIDKMMVVRPKAGTTMSETVNLTWNSQNVPNVRMIPPQPRPSTASFIDLSILPPGAATNITPTNRDDGISAEVLLPDDFRPTFLGTRVSRFKANTNGWMTFDFTSTLTGGSTVTNFPATTLPPLTLAPWIEDLEGNGPGAAILWAMVGSGADRRLVVQWSHWSFEISGTASEGSDLNFQVQMSPEGEIDFVYGPNTCGSVACTATTANLGTNAVVGLSHVPNDGTHQSFGTMVSYKVARPNPNDDGSWAISLSEELPPSGTLPIPLAPTTTVNTSVLSRYYVVTALNESGVVEKNAPLSIIDSDELVITEVMADPAGADDGKEWLEIRSDALRAIDLRGLTISTPRGSVTLAGQTPIPLQGTANNGGLPNLAVVAQSSDRTTNGGVASPIGYGTESTGGVSFDNSADTLDLIADGVVLDSLSYDSNPGLPEPWPLKEGRSLAFAMGGFLPTTTAAGLNYNEATKLPAFWCPGPNGPNRDQASPGQPNGNCYFFERTNTAGTSNGYVPIDVLATLNGATLSGDVVTGTTTRSAAIPLGFTFNHFGESFSDVFLARHGWASFTPISTSGSSAAVDFPFGYMDPTSSTNAYKRTILAPFWTSLAKKAAALNPAVKHTTLGSSPSKIFVAEWIEHKTSTGGTDADKLQVQLRLHENGAIQFLYGDLVGARSKLEAGSSGLSAFGGQLGVKHLFNSTPLGANGTLTPWDVVTLRKVQ